MALFQTMLIVFLFVAAGCSLKEINEQTSRADNVGRIKGKVKVTSDQLGPVAVLHYVD